jgi:aerobic-type carbon monoxide dehydrogenase small subunit (CoxS/CutS family)
MNGVTPVGSRISRTSWPKRDCSGGPSAPGQLVCPYNERVSETLHVNGKPYVVTAEPDTSLLEILRDDLGLTGTKYGCGEGQCGACSVLVDGDLVHSCIAPLSEVKGTAVTTIEGLSGIRLHAVQQAFLDEGAMQCGYCLSGMIIAAVNFLTATPNPTEAEVRDGMSANICRCGCYPRMIEAVKRAAATLRGGK